MVAYTDYRLGRNDDLGQARQWCKELHRSRNFDYMERNRHLILLDNACLRILPRSDSIPRDIDGRNGNNNDRFYHSRQSHKDWRNCGNGIFDTFSCKTLVDDSLCRYRRCCTTIRMALCRLPALCRHIPIYDGYSRAYSQPQI